MPRRSTSAFQKCRQLPDFAVFFLNPPVGVLQIFNGFEIDTVPEKHALPEWMPLPVIPLDSIQASLGSLLGSFIGDALGAQTEVKRGKIVRQAYPDGIWDMGVCSRYVGLAGQVTDDSEMAIMMIQSI